MAARQGNLIAEAGFVGKPRRDRPLGERGGGAVGDKSRVIASRDGARAGRPRDERMGDWVP